MSAAANTRHVQHYFGWEEVAKQLRGRHRVIWRPGDANGTLGTLGAPRQPGRNPRPLYTLFEAFTCHVHSFDQTDPKNEMLQWKAARNLYDAWLAYVYRFGRSTVAITSQKWVSDAQPREFRLGSTIQVSGTIQSMIPDAAAATVETAGNIDVSLLDATDSILVNGEE